MPVPVFFFFFFLSLLTLVFYWGKKRSCISAREDETDYFFKNYWCLPSEFRLSLFFFAFLRLCFLLLSVLLSFYILVYCCFLFIIFLFFFFHATFPCVIYIHYLSLLLLIFCFLPFFLSLLTLVFYWGKKR